MAPRLNPLKPLCLHQGRLTHCLCTILLEPLSTSLHLCLSATLAINSAADRQRASYVFWPRKEPMLPMLGMRMSITSLPTGCCFPDTPWTFNWARGCYLTRQAHVDG